MPPRIHDLVQQTLTHARDLAHDLATLDLTDNDLPAALDGLARHATELFKISCRFNAEGRHPAPGTRHRQPVVQDRPGGGDQCHQARQGQTGRHQPGQWLGQDHPDRPQ